MTSNEPPPYPGDSGSAQGLPSYGSYVPPAVPPPVGRTPPPAGGFQPPLGGGAPFNATDAIRWGWKKFLENVGGLLLAMVLYIVGSIALSAIGSALSGQSPYSSGSVGFEFSPFGSLWQIVTVIIELIFAAGLTRAALDVTEGKKFNIIEAFGRIPIGPVIITSILVTIFTLIGLIALIVGAFIVAWFLSFATYFVVDKNQQPMEAIKSSMNLVQANVGNTVVLFLLSIGVAILGVLACCVGLVAAIPVITLAWAYAYKSFLGEPIAA